jgi:hypothetical protein
MALAFVLAKLIYASTVMELVMKSYTYLGLIGLAAASLFATPASATTCPTGYMGSPTCINTTGGDGPNSSLQDELNGITTSGPNINVYTDQASPSSYWNIGASGGSVNKIMLELAGHANSNTFGIFDPTDTSNYLQLFAGSASTGWSTLLTQVGNTFIATYFDGGGVYQGQDSITLSGNTFGYYLGASSNSPTYYSDPSMNAPDGTYPGGTRRMAAYDGNGTTYLNGAQFLPSEYLLAWEDGSDFDYQDFVVLVESVHPVPEPAVLGMFGLGLLLVGGFVASRRRRYNA